VHQTGFSRALGEIEADLKHAMGISATKAGAAIPEAEVPSHLVSRGAELLNLSVDELWGRFRRA